MLMIQRYTLRCPQGSFVWGGALREITISCPASGQWLETDLWCVDPSQEEAQSRMATMQPRPQTSSKGLKSRLNSL